jgi:hypothetical protein
MGSQVVLTWTNWAFNRPFRLAKALRWSLTAADSVMASRVGFRCERRTIPNQPVKAIVLNGYDVDTGNTLNYIIVTQPANGTLTGAAPNVTYTPNAGFDGSDSFTFKINDGTVDSTPATVTIIVTDSPIVNQKPSAANDSPTTKSGVAITINVTVNDSDPDGDTLTVVIASQPANGTATVSNGKIVYTPNAGFSGNDSFTYTVSNGKGGSATATVTVSVTESTTTTRSIYLPLVSNPEN